MWQSLQLAAEHYFSKGLAASSTRTYTSGTKRYIQCCSACKVTPLPVTEAKLSAFVSLLAKDGLAFSTIRCYLAAVRHHQIACGLGDPGVPTMSRLEYILQGVRREKAGQANKPGTQRQPITPSILLKVFSVWSRLEASALPKAKMLWAAACLAFFGFLRVGEFTSPTVHTFDSNVHLTRQDISVDHPKQPSVMYVTLKQSKTDQLKNGVTLVLGKTNQLLCPVSSMMSYLVVRGSSTGPLFIYPDKSFLTRDRFVDEVRRALHAVGVDPTLFNSHSFRIGAATTAAARGLEDSLIKTLGRWESSAYLRYVKIPRSELANYMKVLADIP